jgi:hypothetical protein
VLESIIKNSFQTDNLWKLVCVTGIEAANQVFLYLEKKRMNWTVIRRLNRWLGGSNC